MGENDEESNKDEQGRQLGFTCQLEGDCENDESDLANNGEDEGVAGEIEEDHGRLQ